MAQILISSHKVHSTFENAEDLHLHMMFKDTLDTGLSDGTRSKLQHPTYVYLWSEQPGMFSDYSNISAFYTLSYLQLYNIVDFRSYFIFLYMPDPFI